jgi:hypothetical protein
MSTPLAPTLLTPMNGESIDGVVSTVFTWEFNDPDPGDTQSAFALRRKTAGAGAYEYWTGAGWSGALTWNVTASETVTLVVANWSNSVIRQWSIATKDVGGNISPFAADRLLISTPRPVATVTAPTGVQTTSRPRVQWSYASSGGFSQKAYRVLVYETSFPASIETDIETPLWDSDWINDPTAYFKDIEVDLENGHSFRAYVKVRSSGDQESLWAYSAFTTTLSLPVSPTVTVENVPELGLNRVNVLTNFNLLTPSDSDLESDIGTWIGVNNCIVSRTAERASAGSYSLKIVGTGATYAQLDATYSDFADQDTTYADFAAEIAAIL